MLRLEDDDEWQRPQIADEAAVRVLGGLSEFNREQDGCPPFTPSTDSCVIECIVPSNVESPTCSRVSSMKVFHNRLDPISYNS